MDRKIGPVLISPELEQAIISYNLSLKRVCKSIEESIIRAERKIVDRGEKSNP